MLGKISNEGCPYPTHPYLCPKKMSWCVPNETDCLHTKADLVQQNPNFSTKRSKLYRTKMAKQEVKKVKEEIVKSLEAPVALTFKREKQQKQQKQFKLERTSPKKEGVTREIAIKQAPKTAKEMELVLIAQKAEAVRLMKYPNFDDPYKQFMNDVLNEFGLRLKIHVDFAQAFDLCKQNAQPELTMYQKFASTYLTPRSPAKGLILYHSVGSGKTISAFSILRSFRGSFDNLWWITSVAQRRDIKNRTFDLQAFDPTIKFEQSGIMFKSYEQMRNILLRANEEGRKLWGNAKPYKRISKNQWGDADNHVDPLRKTVIVIDEAHLIFNEKEGTPELIEQAILDSYRKSGPDSVRIVLMTATPIPGGEKTLTDEEKLQRVFTPLRLMNMLIPNPEKRFPINKNAFVDAFVDKTGRKLRVQKFLEMGKGLVSYFDATNSDWTKSAFAVVEEQPRRVSPASKQLETKLSKKGTACTSAAKTKEARYTCYRKAASWAPSEGQFPPESWKIFSKSFNPKTVLKQAPQTASKAVDLVNNIKQIDEQDMKLYGKQFKHAIYTNVGTALGLQPVTAVMEASGFQHLKIAPSIDHSNAPTQSDEPNSVFVFDNKMSPEESKEIFKRFNDHLTNNYGQTARFAVLDNKYKEGIDLYDVRHFHIFEPQLTKTDTIQVIGRAVRRCGHTGLPENERQVLVYTYDLAVPRKFVVTDKPGDEDPVDFGEHIAFNLKGESIIDSLTDIILGAMRKVAVDKDLLYPSKRKKKTKTDMKRKTTTQLKHQLSEVTNFCQNDWTQLQNELQTLDDQRMQQKLNDINTIIAKTTDILKQSNEINALLQVHAHQYIGVGKLQEALDGITLQIRPNDINKITILLNDYCSHISAILSIVDEGKRAAPLIGILTQEPPQHRLPKDQHQFNLKYPKVKRFELVDVENKREFILFYYIEPFFPKQINNVIEKSTSHTFEMPKNLKPLFANFNYHPDAVIQFNKTYTAIPIFQWQERSTIDFTKPPTTADVRALFLVDMQSYHFRILMRDKNGVPVFATDNTPLTNEILANLAGWFKIPNMEFVANL